MIGVLAAYHAANAGMVSSNLALAQLLGQRAREAVYLNIEVDDRRWDGHLAYRNAREAPELLNADLLIGWGDFIHCIGWARHELANQTRERSNLSREQTLEAWFKVYMAEGAEPSRFLSFGSTLYTNRLPDYAFDRYARALRALGERARLFAFRDPVSTAQLSNLLGLEPELGCDPAFLLDGDAAVEGIELPESLRREPYAAACFGRAGLLHEKARLAEWIAARHGLRTITLPWLGIQDDGGFRQCLAILRGASLCISDVYHLCVNALREGVPVLCLLRSGRAATTLDDEKKRLLFYSLGLADQLVDIEEAIAIKHPRGLRALVDDLVERVPLRDGETGRIAGVDRMAARWKQRLKAELDLAS